MYLLKTIYIYTLLCACIFCTDSLHAQDVQELRQHLNSANSDSQQVLVLNKMAFAQRQYHLDSMRYFAQLALQKSKQLQWPIEESKALNAIGTYHKYSSAKDSAEKYFRKALYIRQSINDTIYVANSYLSLATLYRISNTPVALALLDSAFSYADSLAHTEVYTKLINTQGNIFFESGEHSLAIDCYLKALRLGTSNKDSFAVAKAQQNIGHVYLELEELEEAKRYLNQSKNYYKSLGAMRAEAALENTLGLLAAEEKNYAEAEKAYKKSLSLYTMSEFTGNLSKVYGNLGTLYHLQNQLPKAVAMHNESLQLALADSNDLDAAITAKELALVYTDLDQQDSVYHFLLLGWVKLNTSDHLDLRGEYLKLWGNHYEVLGELDTAYFFLRQYTELQDSLAQNTLVATQKLARFDRIEAKNKELIAEAALQSSDAEKAEALNARNEILIGALGVMFVASVAFFFFLTRSRNQKQRIAIKNQQLQVLLQQKEVDALDDMAEARETERLNIAQDLHDELGALMAALKIHFSRMASSRLDNEELFATNVKNSSALLDLANAKVRQIATDLRTGVLHEFGLIAAIRDLCQEMEKAGAFRLELHLGKLSDKFPEQLQRPLFRIISESLQNILKHAQASEVTIQLLQTEKRIHLTVQDNGIGFDINKTKSKGAGLSNMRVRTKKYGGTFTIDSAPGHGTTLLFEFYPQNK